jgi:nucleoside phosphorylase
VIEHWQPELIVFCGIAGGISGREGVSYGDIVVPEYVHYCSFAKLSEGGRQLRYIPYDHPSIKLHEDYAAPLRYMSWSADDIPPGLEPPKVLTNSLVGGDKVYGDPTSEEQQAIVRHFDDAVAFDMESVGLCRAVASSRSNPLYNPRLLIVRSISDMADSQTNNADRRQWKEYACTMASQFLACLIKSILDSEPDPRPRERVSA